MSHEVDLLTGLSREPGDFTQRVNRHFLEDHVFLTKTELIGPSFIDPAAAFTLEYVDLQLNMIRNNLTQLYVPSARAEFRLWHFEWQDIAYFVRRRSEEQARRTKQHLETKWGVQFPNTGFCNFVKFSVIRHASFGWEALPSKWIEQAALVAAFFEMAGFNRHGASDIITLPLEAETATARPSPHATAGPAGLVDSQAAGATGGMGGGGVADATLEGLLFSLRESRRARNVSSINTPVDTPGASRPGLAFLSRRSLVPTAEVRTDSWRSSGIGDLLPFQDRARRLETRYQVEHMSLALLRVPLGPSFPHLDASRIRPLCGLLSRTLTQDVCWIYVAPHRYDHPGFQLLEALLGALRVGPRIALAIAMKLTNSELEPGAHAAAIRRLRRAGVEVVMCGEHHWRCEVKYKFEADARLLQWQGRINSWPTVVRTILPSAEELGWLYALMALIVCLGATATAHSATQAKATFAVLLADWLLTLAAHDLRLLWPHPAHAPILLWATRYALLSPRRRRAALAFWLAVFGLVNSRVISRYECLALITATVALCTARRVYLAILTLVANHKPSLLLPLLARLVGSLNTSRALSAAHSSADSVGSFPDLSTGRLCASGCQARELVGPALVLLDRPSPALAARRREALARLDQRWLVRWPRATELAAALCGAERVAMSHDCEQVTPQRGKAQTSDADPVAAGSGSAWEMVSEVESGSGSEGMLPRCGVHSVAGGVAPEPAIGVGEAGGASVASDDASHNASVLCAISRKAQARFHVSGSEALNTAVLLARLNTGRPMLLVFGGNAHGWTDGVAQEGLALGEERYACDVITARDMSSSTLRLITTRADEIAAVVLNPLQGVLRAAVGHGGGGGTSAHPPSGTGASSEFGEWLRRLRATCTASRVPLIFDESATGFRLALGGAQEYFGVSADVVCYGKTLGGGLPVGVVCGASWLMEDSEPHLPLRAGTGGSARGGMACNAGLMRRTRRFLDEVTMRDYSAVHASSHEWTLSTNVKLRAAGTPLMIYCEASVWGMRFTRASRYHWVLQYLLRDEGIQLLWLGPRRIGQPMAATPKMLAETSCAVVRAARRMCDEGWWAPEGQVGLDSDARIRARLATEVGRATAAGLLMAMRQLLPPSVQRRLAKSQCK
mmetsp:Transcript_32939/g.105036  ORF Transcript_32939/g.105036 Transcript_32939/m.105036 type:complete len:1137 (+) Transcript_32939:233-3643(+)